MAQPRIIRRIRKALDISLPTAGTSWASIPRAELDYQRTIGNGRNSSVVTAPLAWIVRNWAEAVLQIRELENDGVVEALPNHPLAQKLRMPNAEYSGTTLQKATIADYKITGNAYWIVAYDRTGRVAEIWWAPETTMTPEALKQQDAAPSAETRQVAYYKYQPGNGQTYHIAPVGVTVEGTQPGLGVLHFRDGINPSDPLLGYSPLQSVLREVFTDDEASIYTASLLKNMGVPGIIVSPSESAGALPPPAAEDVKETKRAFIQATTGTRRGEPIIMTGPTKLTTFGFDPQQMNVATVRRIPEERVCGALGVQPAACGLGAVLEQAKFANMQQAREASWEEGILPTQRDIAETIAMRLLPLYESQPERFAVVYDTSMVRALSEDQDKIADRAIRLMTGGVITLAEARGMVGAEVEESDDVWRMPLNLIDIPRDENADAAMPAPVEDEDNPPDLPEARRANANLAGRKEANPRLNQMQRRTLIMLRRDALRFASAFERDLEKAFKDLGREAAAEWRNQGGSQITGIPVKEDAAGFGARFETIIRNTLKALKLEDWAESTLGGIYKRHYTTVISETGKELAGLGITVGNPDAVQVGVIRSGGTRYRLVNISKQTEDAIRSVIGDALEQSLGPQAIERLIRERVEGGPSRSVSARAMRIARTEVLHAQRTSTLEFYRESGLYATVIASDNNLGYDDEVCAARDGQEIPFTLADDWIADSHPNCTLAFVPGTLIE
jgi:HK97 family phage portal protein